MLRRILAITLLIAFGFPFVAPAFATTPDPEASLPACCRSHGTHHCAMLHKIAASSTPSFNSPPCPFYPAPSTAPSSSSASVAVATSPIATLIRGLAPPPAMGRNAACTFLAAANLKRGPPVA